MAIIINYDHGDGRIDLDMPKGPVEIGDVDVFTDDEGDTTVTIRVGSHECEDPYDDPVLR